MATVALQPYLITVDDYHAMGRAGIFTEDDRVELIEGQIVTMSPIGSRHAACVYRLNQFFWGQLGNRTIIGTQSPVRLSSFSEPEPDLAVLRFREDFYEEAHPKPADVLLLIEVADSTLKTDRQIKVPLYARHGIPEVWLVALPEDRVEIFRDPTPEEYTTVEHFGRGEALHLEAFPDIELPVAAILGKPKAEHAA